MISSTLLFLVDKKGTLLGGGLDAHREPVGGPSDCAATTDNSNAPKRRRKGRDRKKMNQSSASVANARRKKGKLGSGRGGLGGSTRRAPTRSPVVAPSPTQPWPCRSEEQLPPLADPAGQEGVRYKMHRRGSRRWGASLLSTRA